MPHIQGHSETKAIVQVPTTFGMLRVPVDRIPETEEEKRAIADQALRRFKEQQLQEFEAGRQQAFTIAETPEFQEQKRREAAEGRRTMGQFLRRAAPSAILGVGAAAAAPPLAAALKLGKFAKPALTAGLEAIAGGGGEAAAQAIEGEEFDPGKVKLATILPGATRGVMSGTRGAFKFGIRRAPGAEVLIREQARKRIEALPATLRPTESSEVLYAEVRRDPKVRIKMQNTLTKAEELNLAEEEILPGLQSATVKRATRGAPGKLSTGKPERTEATGLLDVGGKPITRTIPAVPDEGIDFGVAQANLRRLGARIRQAERGLTQEDAGALRQFRGAIMEDMEAAGKKYATLRQANDIFKRETAADDLGEMITLSTKSQGEFDVINVDTLRDRFRRTVTKDRLFREGLGEDNVAKVDQFLKDLGTEASKASRVGTVVLFGAAGFEAARALGLESGASLLGGATAYLGPEIVETIILSDWGRAMFLRLMREGAGKISRPALAVLANTIRAGASGGKQEQ